MQRRGDFVHFCVKAGREHTLVRSAVWLRNSWRNYTQMRFNLWTRLWPVNGTL